MTGSRKKRNRKAIIIVFLFFVVGAYLFMRNIQPFLCYSEVIPANVIVVEGWLQTDALEQAKKIIQGHSCPVIITTGFQNSPDMRMGSNGRLCFTVNSLVPEATNGVYSITLMHRGSRADNAYPYFRLLADSTLAGESFSTGKPGRFTCSLKLTRPPEKITVEFDNDTYTLFRDRNLYVYSIEINRQLFDAGNCSVKLYARKGGKYHFRQHITADNAHDARRYLMDAGIPDSLIVPVTTLRKRKSKTYSTALDVKEYLQHTHPDMVPAITVITKGPHARRSYICFKKAFGESARIGVISLPDDELSYNNWWKTAKGWQRILYETIGVVYTAVAL